MSRRIFTKRMIILSLISLLPILLLIYGYSHPIKFFSTQDSIRSFVESYEVLAPIVFVFIQIFQVVVTPLSHYVVGIAGGYIFGTYYGFFLNWIGRIIGHAIAFFIARYGGRPIIKRFVKQETFGKYDKIWEKGVIVLFFIYFLPFFPDDEISYIVGLSKMSFRTFLLANIFGHIGGSMALAYVGSGIDIKSPLFYSILILTLIAYFMFFILLRNKRRREKDEK